MGSPLPQVQFRAGSSVDGAPPTLLQLLTTAAEGGQATYDFFSTDAQARAELARLAAQGDSAWTLHPDAADLGHDFLTAGQPAYVATGSSGQLIVQSQLSPDVMQADSTDYKEAGVATMWMVTSQGPVEVFVSYVEKLGPGVTAAALGPALLTLLGAFKSYVASFFSNVSTAAEGGATDAATVASDAAEGAAEEAAVDGEIIADEVAVSVSFGPLAIVGLAVAAISIVLMILAFGFAKTMTAWIRLFNATSLDLQLSLAYQYNLTVRQQPAGPTVPAIGAPPAPPGITPLDKVVYWAEYLLQNDNTLGGLGLVLQAAPAGAFPGFSVAIEIPSIGANGLTAAFDGTLDAAAYFNGQTIAQDPHIVALQQQIKAVQAEIQAVDAEVAVLHATADAFAALAGSGQGALQALSEVTSSWDGMAGDIDEIATDIATASQDLPAQQVQDAAARIGDVAAVWGDLVAAMTILSGVQVMVSPSIEPIPA
jgi:hypothetical protein